MSHLDRFARRALCLHSEGETATAGIYNAFLRRRKIRPLTAMYVPADHALLLLLPRIIIPRIDHLIRNGENSFIQLTHRAPSFFITMNADAMRFSKRSYSLNHDSIRGNSSRHLIFTDTESAVDPNLPMKNWLSLYHLQLELRAILNVLWNITLKWISVISIQRQAKNVPLCSKTTNYIWMRILICHPLWHHRNHLKSKCYRVAQIPQANNFVRGQLSHWNMINRGREFVKRGIAVITKIFCHPILLSNRVREAIGQQPQLVVGLSHHNAKSSSSRSLPALFCLLQMPYREESSPPNRNYCPHGLHPSWRISMIPWQREKEVNKHNDYWARHEQFEDIRQLEAKVKLAVHKWLLAIRNYARLPAASSQVHGGSA